MKTINIVNITRKGLRKKFEKETGLKAQIWQGEIFRFLTFTDNYTEWLEKKILNVYSGKQSGLFLKNFPVKLYR